MILRERWREAEIMEALAWLRHENAAGAQIYVRPAGVHALTLIDDLTAETVQHMAGEGFEPAVVVETSRGNYQVWLKHAEVLDETIVHCPVCQDHNVVTVEDADRWRNEMRKRHG
jgi:hypothetical protein